MLIRKKAKSSLRMSCSIWNGMTCYRLKTQRSMINICKFFSLVNKIRLDKKKLDEDVERLKAQIQDIEKTDFLD